MAKRIFILAVIAVLLAGGLFVRQGMRPALKVSGLIEADEIRLASRVGGRVAAVRALEGQEVRPGEVLIELEPFDLLQRKAEAEAQVASATAEHAKLAAGFRAEEIAQAAARREQLAAVLEKLVNGPRAQEIAAAEAELKLSRAELELAQAEFRRTEALFGGRVSSQDQFDKAKSQLKIAEEAAAVQEQRLAVLREGTRPEEIAEARARLDEATQGWQLMVNGSRAEDIAQAAARLDAAKASLAAIEEQVRELAIRSPVSGVVEAVELQPGDMVAANAPAVSIMDTSRLWVRAYVPENRLGLKVGDRVPLTVDSFPGEEFVGRISFVARQAEFTPGNVQTPEERSKQVFRIKVALEADSGRLRPGMSADVWLDRREPGE